MEAENVGGIELLGLVMDGMEPPEPRPGVGGAVQPVAKKIPDDDLGQELRPDRPVTRPYVEQNDGVAELLIQQPHHRPYQSQRQRDLHDEQIKPIVDKI